MLTLFFVDDLPTTVGSSYEFDSEDAHHAIKVLRIAAGEIFNLSDGKGAWSRVSVTNVNKKSMTVKVLESGFEEALPVEFTVAQALTKGDRIKESIELNTAGGADVILLWAAARSIGKATPDLMQKLATTAREASKQTRRNRIPFVMGVLDAKKIAAELRNWVAKEIGPIAKPKDIRFGENLPKTRSGKIMRRLLRSIAKGEAITQDTSTLENPAILDQLGQAY